VSAAGRSAGELLDIARARLTNDRDIELRIAAEEQRKITNLRLEKLIMESA
jgi:2-oxo-4-hydroxy-4-carboxy--5-ureidoimidazoline (OHCU) decarboxylase